MSVNPRSFTVLAADQIGADNRQWIEVMPTVTEARNGPWLFTITRADLEAYAQAISDNPGRIPVDYDHAGAREDGSTKAAGWFTGQARVVDTSDRGPILEAQVQWTPSGAEAVRNGDFKMISPEFNFSEQDKKTGLMTKAKQIIAATLTNRPYFKQLAALAAEMDEQQVASLATDLGVPAEEFARFLTTHGGRAAQTQGDTMSETLKALAAELGLPDDSTEEQVMEAVKAAKAKSDEHHDETADLTAYAAALGLPETASETEILAAIKDAREAADSKAHRRARTRKGGSTMADISAFAEALGLDPSADEATVLAAVRKAAEDSDRVSSLEDEHEGLTATAREKLKLEQRVKTIEAERRAERVQRLLVDAVRDGQVLPAEKTVLAKTFAENPEALVELINARPKRSWAEIGSGDGFDDSVDVLAAKQRFDSAEADGVDPDSVRLHVRAEQWLAERGKKPGTYTDIDYAQACDAVELERVL